MTVGTVILMGSLVGLAGIGCCNGVTCMTGATWSLGGDIMCMGMICECVGCMTGRTCSTAIVGRGSARIHGCYTLCSRCSDEFNVRCRQACTLVTGAAGSVDFYVCTINKNTGCRA